MAVDAEVGQRESDGLYDCARCPDEMRRLLRCRYPLRQPVEGYPDYSADPQCPTYRAGPRMRTVQRAAALWESGQIGLDDLDGWYLQAIEALQAERIRRVREDRRGDDRR